MCVDCKTMTMLDHNCTNATTNMLMTIRQAKLGSTIKTTTSQWIVQVTGQFSISITSPYVCTACIVIIITFDVVIKYTLPINNHYHSYQLLC